MEKILLILIFSFSFLFAQTPRVSLSRDSVNVGEICTMTVIFDEGLQALSLVNPSDWVGGVRFREAREIFSPGEKRFEFLLSFYETPICTIPPISFLLQGENGIDTVKTEPIVVRVPSVFEKLDSVRIRRLSEKDALPRPMRAGRMPIAEIVLLQLILAAAVALIIILLRKYLKKKKEKVYIVPPFEEAISALQLLDEENLINKGEYKKFVFSLSAILKRFVARRYGVPIEEATSTEFKQWLKKSDLSRENKILLEKFINETDPVKFADLTPDIESLRELRASVEEFFKITRPIDNLSSTESKV
jgi:hypothetical protein